MGSIVDLLKKLFLTNPTETHQLKQAIYSITKLKPGNMSVYKLALQHGSSKETTMTNERLEFLGDAVLSLIIGEYLFKKYPLKGEGFLTDIRARIVNRESLNTLAKQLGIHQLLQCHSHLIQGNRCKFIYGNALEALIGAVYLDQGYQKCVQFVIDQLLHHYLDLPALIQCDRNYKSQLVMWAQKERKAIQFKIVEEQQAKQGKEFTAQVLINEQAVGQGSGFSKKQAEQKAAQAALQKIPPPLHTDPLLR